MNIEEIIKKINLNPRDPVLIHTIIPGSQSLYLLKPYKAVYYEDPDLYGLKGIEFLVDNDLSVYVMSLVGPQGVYLLKEGLEEGTDLTIRLCFGEKEIKEYLQRIDQWERKINFKDKLNLWLKFIIDTYINNELK